MLWLAGRDRAGPGAAAGLCYALAVKCAWGIALLCGVLGVAGGCGELGEDFAYRGVRKLDSGDYYVSTVAWLEYLPVAFASRLEDPEQSRVLRLVPLGVDGVKPCSTQPATRFIAVGGDGDYRVAVLDGATGELGFYDRGCARTGGLAEVGRVEYLGEHHFLAHMDSGAVRAVQPFEDTDAEIGRDVVATGGQPVQFQRAEAGATEMALWVFEQDGTLELRDLEGQVVGPRYDEVRAFATHRGASYTTTRLMAYQHGGGVVVVEAASAEPLQEDGRIQVEPLWGLAEACAPRFVDVRTTVDLRDCDDPSCEGLAELGASGSVTLQRPWLAAFQPCESRTLVLNEIYGPGERTVASQVRRFVVPNTPVGDDTVVLYTTGEADGPRRRFYRRGEQEAIEIDVPVDLSLWSEDPRTFPVMRVFTDEAMPRYGTWSPEGGFTELLTGVYPSANTTLVLHDYSEGLGTLSYCSARRCTELATGVPRDRYRKYTTLERIGDGPDVLSFIHGVVPDAPGGTLTALREDTGQRVDLDEGVNSFAPIENGPARGIVYTVRDDGERQGLWFAPR